MPKDFTIQDVIVKGYDYHKIITSTDDLIQEPLPWQKKGLQQTASGYGSKLTSSYKILFEGKRYRIYTTIWSNSGSSWFKYKGKKIYVQ
jgi:hypothetical protein